MKQLISSLILSLLCAGIPLVAEVNLAEYRDVVGKNATRIVFSEGFENKSNPWKLRGASLTRDGANGSGGLTMERKRIEDAYHITTLPLKLTPSKRYRIRYDAHFENMKITELAKRTGFVSIEYYSNGKFIRGAHILTPEVKDGDNPWLQGEGVAECPPAPNLKVQIALYIPRDATGKVTYDNILIEEIGENLPLVYLISPKNLNVSDASTLRFRVENYGRGKSLLLHIVCNDLTLTGKVVNGEAVVKCPAFPAGKNTLQCYVLDSANKIRYGEVTCNVFNVPRNANGITVRDDGALMRNGKPFLPVGIYATFGLQESDVKRIVEGGFNSLLYYSSFHLNVTGEKGLTQLQAIRKSLDVFSQNNLMLIFSVKDRNKKIDNIEGDAAISYLVNGIKDHPALMAWYVSDENTLGEIPEIVHFRELISGNDPDHPVFTLTNKPHHALYFGPTGDIFIGDPYPIHGEESQSMSLVREFLTGVNQGSDFRCWLAPQAFHWGGHEVSAPYSKNRYPTEQEMRSMVLLAMNLGAKGYAFFSYTTIFYRQEKRDPGSAKIFWPEVCKAAKLLRELEPFFFTEEKPPAIRVASRGKSLVEAKAYRIGKQLKIVVTSDGPGVGEAVITVPWEGKLKSRYGLTKQIGENTYLFKAENIASDILENPES